VNEIADQLATHPFFAGMPTRLVERIAALAAPAEFAAGSWILRAGELANEFHAVMNGRAGVEIASPGHEPLLVATVHPGEVLGWSWFVEPHRWHFDVLAIDDVRTISIDAARLRDECSGDHELGHHLAHRLTRVVASRLEATRHQLVDVYGRAR
jgi:CRP/FNR family cyclic AMP-dependent transcriptional regulator